MTRAVTSSHRGTWAWGVTLSPETVCRIFRLPCNCMLVCDWVSLSLSARWFVIFLQDDCSAAIFSETSCALRRPCTCARNELAWVNKLHFSSSTSVHVFSSLYLSNNYIVTEGERGDRESRAHTHWLLWVLLFFFFYSSRLLSVTDYREHTVREALS